MTKLGRQAQALVRWAQPCRLHLIRQPAKFHSAILLRNSLVLSMCEWDREEKERKKKNRQSSHPTCRWWNNGETKSGRESHILYLSGQGSVLGSMFPGPSDRFAFFFFLIIHWVSIMLFFLKAQSTFSWILLHFSSSKPVSLKRPAKVKEERFSKANPIGLWAQETCST